VTGAVEPVELEPGEEIRASAFASFRGAARTSTRSTFGWAPSAKRRQAHREWADAVTAAGFPEAPADMALAATDRRLLVGKPTLWGRQPASYQGALRYEQIADVAVVRHGLVVGIALALRNGHIVEIEAMRGRKLRALARVVEAALSPS